MSLYDSMLGALREHGKADDNAYPQCVELTKAALEELNTTRQTVKTSIGLKALAGDDFKLFHGVKLALGDSKALVAKDGTRVPLG